VFEVMAAVSAFIAGAIASVTGFGIGSILTPLLSLQAGTRIAVAAVSIPHVVATFTRFWVLRRSIDRRVLIDFGLWSAAGGIVGALLHSIASNPVLTYLLAFLLMFAGFTGMTGQARKMHFGPKVARLAGAVSGMLGGLVGNQGGIRSAALMGFHLDQKSFIATATAVGVIVDAVRMPVYFATEASGTLSMLRIIVVCTIGTLAGTFFGLAVLRGIRHRYFYRIVGGVVFLLGAFMFVQAVRITAGSGSGLQ
jgi:uncharacterized membrane protein YfcA